MIRWPRTKCNRQGKTYRTKDGSGQDDAG